MIPKIIHHTGPTDKSRWNIIWQDCYESWKKPFPEPEYKHVFWNDEQLDQFFEDNYPQYKYIYDDFPLRILKIDFFKMSVLNTYGGIYADLDIYCYKNFYDLLTKDLYIMQSGMNILASVQSFLMASVPNHPFWQRYYKHVENYYHKFKHTFPEIKEKNLVTESFTQSFCGERALSKLLRTEKNYDKFPRKMFNPLSGSWLHPDLNCDKYDEEYYIVPKLQPNKNEALAKFRELNNKEDKVYTRHWGTGMWGPGGTQTWANFCYDT